MTSDGLWGWAPGHHQRMQSFWCGHLWISTCHQHQQKQQPQQQQQLDLQGFHLQETGILSLLLPLSRT